MAKSNEKITVVKPNWLQIEHLKPRAFEGPALLVLGTANAFGPEAALREYERKKMCPHATLDIDTGQLYQHIPWEFGALTVPDATAFKPAFSTTSYWIMLGCSAGHALTEDQVKIVAKVIKDLAKKLEVTLEFSEFPPPQSSVALSSVINTNQWDEAGGVISSTITPNSHWPSLLQECADALQVELKLKKRLEFPNPDEVEFVKSEVNEDKLEAEQKEDAEEAKVTETLEKMVKASEDKKKASSTKKEESKEEASE